MFDLSPYFSLVGLFKIPFKSFPSHNLTFLLIQFLWWNFLAAKSPFLSMYMYTVHGTLCAFLSVCFLPVSPTFPSPCPQGHFILPCLLSSPSHLSSKPQTPCWCSPTYKRACKKKLANFPETHRCIRTFNTSHLLSNHNLLTISTFLNRLQLFAKIALLPRK